MPGVRALAQGPVDRGELPNPPDASSSLLAHQVFDELCCPCRFQVKKENPEADFKEVSNTLGAKWKALGAEEKQPYEERYRQEKEAYLQVVGQEKREAEAMKLLEEQQMQWTAKELLDQYLKFRQEAEEGDCKKGRKKKSKKDKDPSKPKQPMSAYFVYSQERRATLVAEKKNVPEVNGLLSYNFCCVDAYQFVLM